MDTKPRTPVPELSVQETGIIAEAHRPLWVGQTGVQAKEAGVNHPGTGDITINNPAVT